MRLQQLRGPITRWRTEWWQRSGLTVSGEETRPVLATSTDRMKSNTTPTTAASFPSTSTVSIRRLVAMSDREISFKSGRYSHTTTSFLNLYDFHPIAGLLFTRFSPRPDSGVTRVGDTRGGNWGCHRSIFSWKTWRPFLVANSALSPLISSSQKLMTFFCSSLYRFLLLSFQCHPLEGVPLHLFYLSDLVSPVFFVNLTTIFLLRVSPLDGVTRGGPPRPL